MKIDKPVIGSFILLVLIASLYRVFPDRPLGFAPQIAMALFAGSVIKDKKLSFLLPLLSMFISDIIFEVLYYNGLSAIGGFYKGQLLNYILFGGITFIGFFIKSDRVLHIAAGSIIGPTVYFLLSNFLDWAGGGLDIFNQPYPKTFSGLINCYVAGLAFYKGSIYATFCFSMILFGGYYLVNKLQIKETALAE